MVPITSGAPSATNVDPTMAPAAIVRIQSGMQTKNATTAPIGRTTMSMIRAPSGEIGTNSSWRIARFHPSRAGGSCLGVWCISVLVTETPGRARRYTGSVPALC